MFRVFVEENDKEIVLAWDDVPGAVNYKVYRSDAVADMFSLVATIISSSYTDTLDVLNSIPYTYYIEACDSTPAVIEVSEQTVAVPNSIYKWTLPLHIGTFYYGDDVNLSREFYTYYNPSTELVPSGVSSYTLNNYPLQNAPIAIYPIDSDIPLMSTALSVANVNAAGIIPQLAEARAVPITEEEMQERDYYLMGHNDFVMDPSGIIRFTNPTDGDCYVVYEKEENIFNVNETIDINPITGNVHTGFLYIDDLGDGNEISLKQSNYLIPVDGKSTIKYIATLRDSKGNRVYVNNTTKTIEQFKFELVMSADRLIHAGATSTIFFNPILGNVFTDNPDISNITIVDEYNIAFANAASSSQLVRFYFKTTDDLGKLEESDTGTKIDDVTVLEHLDRYGQARVTYRVSETNYGDVSVLVSLVSNPDIKTLSDGDTTLGGRSTYEGPFQLDYASLDGPTWLISQDMYDNFYFGKYDPSLQGIMDAFDSFHYDENGNFIY